MYQDEEAEIEKFNALMRGRQETYRQRVNSGDAANKWIAALRSSAERERNALKPRLSREEHAKLMDKAIERCKSADAAMRAGHVPATAL